MTSTVRFPLLRFARPSQAGFTLVELMVGLAIGMLATLVVMQVFSVFEAQKRATTGAADAQTDGNIALYTVTRDLQLAGYGLIPDGKPSIADSALECPSVTDFTAASAVAADLSPVTIVDGGSGNGGDSIIIRYGTSSTGGIPTRITTAVTTDTMTVQASTGCKGGDIALIMNTAGPMVCALAQVASGVPAPYTISFSDSRARTSGAAVQSALIACLGSWNVVTYSVDSVNGNLVVQNGTNAPVPIVAGIVNMQAQYGIADPLASNDPNFNKIVQWVDATGATWANPTVANRNRIKAVRIAIAARSATFAPNIVTTACNAGSDLCAWTALSPAPRDASPAPNIKLLGTGNTDWGHYRYKVFETIVPLRNVIWSRGTL